ncbi:MAG: type III-B CRISPR module-associated protein Cmr3 [Chloracidobacterium sp.]|nr:type III-B CRISPR module-associated protein Cmr3 [Chloracidobacterium sp.]MDW8218686.1 type III-B CRISPR module-associated protein Cmr3 [Acidobacteriota bacterium]
MSHAGTPHTIGLRLEPLDVLFFRDGRPFGSERNLSGWPTPQTFAGAIRTALLEAAGCNFARLAQAIQTGKSFAEAVEASCPTAFHWIGRVMARGVWPARVTPNGQPDVLTPAPSVLHVEKNQPTKLHRLQPLPPSQLPGWQPPPDDSKWRPLWLKNLAPTEPVEGYLTQNGLATFLAGGVPNSDEIVSPSALFALDYRTGVTISPDSLTVEASQIFSCGFLALKPGVTLYGEVDVPDDVRHDAEKLIDALKLMAFGGEGRRVVVARLAHSCPWPQRSPSRDKERPLTLLITPCPFASRWKPHALTGRVIAAAVPGATAFSGWDLARGGPKPTRFAAAAGSVYFLDEAPPMWPASLAESNEDAALGWGGYLKGVWNDV